MNKTTVVISNYNYDNFVKCAIESVIKQTVRCNIIVVDDASTDNSWKVIKNLAVKYKNKLPFCAIRLKENSKGNARGKNIGICLSKSPYVTCLDSDDMLLPNSIEIRQNKLEQVNADWVHGKAIYLESNTVAYNKIARTLYPPVRGHKRRKLVVSNYTLRVLNAMPGVLVRKNDFKYDRFVLLEDETDLKWYKGVEASTVLAKKEVYEEYGLYDEILKWKIDREMWYRFLKHGAKKRFLNSYVSIYRKHPNQATKNKFVKNPKKINNLFNIIVEEREKLTDKNTSFINNYNPYDYIQVVVGNLP